MAVAAEADWILDLGSEPGDGSGVHSARTSHKPAASLTPVECPNPLRSLVTGQAGFTVETNEIHHLGIASNCDLAGQVARVGDDENLRVVRDFGDQLRQRRHEVRVEASFRLVDHDQRRWPGG